MSSMKPYNDKCYIWNEHLSEVIYGTYIILTNDILAVELLERRFLDL